MKSTYRYLTILSACLLIVVNSTATSPQHPRILIKDSDRNAFLIAIEKVPWKKAYVAQLKQDVDQYVSYWEKDPDWLVARLQMNWKTRHHQVFLKGGDFSHSAGQAPVPTVRFSGSRDWATDYLVPEISEIAPYADDPRGILLTHKETGQKEWVHPAETGHIIEGMNRKIMQVVQDAAFLYWLTGEERYAAFAEPVFTKYIAGMYHREAPVDTSHTHQQLLSGLATFEVIHEKIVIYLTVTYDFLYPYLAQKKLNQEQTTAVFQRWADQIIQNGVGDNNWNFFQARFLTYLAIALEPDTHYANGKGQDHYLEQIFDVSTDRQIALRESILIYDQQTGIWPESPAYSMHVTTTLLEILTLLDHLTDDHEFANYPIVEKATLASFQYLFPSGYAVGFGDSDHKTIPPANFELLLANYDKYGATDKAALIANMLQTLIDKADYERAAKNLFQLMVYVDDLPTNAKAEAETALLTPTFYASNVSLFIQRLGKGKNATMVSTVGSYGNHAHVNGISLELFANGYVLGPDMSKGPSYWHPVHREYYSQFPAHNTVAVNGSSAYGAMRSYHPYTLDNCFPAPGATANLFEKVTFAKVSFVEPKNQAQQQRLTAQIAAETGQVYVLDVFRSAVDDLAPQKHEYFYHNLGQSLEILDAEHRALPLQPTTELSTQAGDLKGYDYFKEKYAVQTDQDLRAVFRLQTKDAPDNLMKLWVKGSEDQTVYAVKAPKSNALAKGTAPAEMMGQELPTLILKRTAAAWNNPFVVLFNPYLEGENKVIDQVSFAKVGERGGAQEIRVNFTEQQLEDRIVVNASVNDIARQDGFYQKGLFSVVRTASGQGQPLFIFASGVYHFRYADWQILSIGEAATVSIESVAEGLRIRNDQPVMIKIPRRDGQPIPSIKIYQAGKVVAERRGIISRLDPQQIEFRLPMAYEQTIIN